MVAVIVATPAVTAAIHPNTPASPVAGEADACAKPRAMLAMACITMPATFALGSSRLVIAFPALLMARVASFHALAVSSALLETLGKKFVGNFISGVIGCSLKKLLMIS